jgi:oxaloacetate decarboxylase gamma subunit
MTILEMFGQSGVLMLLGMAVVFLFLIILVVAITLAGRVIHAAGWDKEAATVSSGGANEAGGTLPRSGFRVQAQPAGAVVAAITAAVTAHKKA